MNGDITSTNDIDEPFRIIPLIIMILAVTGFIYWIMIESDARASRMSQINFNEGVKRATKSYSKQYAMTNDNLKSLADGYLISEDFLNYAVATNHVQVDLNAAFRNYLTILSGNTMIPQADLRKMKLYMIHVYTAYEVVPLTTNIKEAYYLTIYDMNKTLRASIRSNSLLELEQTIESICDVDIDIYNTFYSSVHKALKYDRRGKTGNNIDTYSTYNTYMTIGKDIPIKGRFKETYVTFNDIQTFSTKR